MMYVKLIGLHIDDFCSSIVFEKNYRSNEPDTYILKKKELEENGQVCILANVESNVEL